MSFFGTSGNAIEQKLEPESEGDAGPLDAKNTAAEEVIVSNHTQEY